MDNSKLTGYNSVGLVYNEPVGITQEEMANRLRMPSRTYVDLDHSKTCCSTLALALFLIYICADPLAFLEELQNVLENSDQNAA